MMTLSDQELDELISRVVKITLAESGVTRPQISQNRAFNMYGRNRIMEWRHRGIVNPIKQGSRIFYYRSELFAAHKTAVVRSTGLITKI